MSNWRSNQNLVWKSKVLSRDKCICRRCGYKGRNKKDIQVHHIKTFVNYPALRYEISNGITLCKRCHLMMKSCEESWERACILLLMKKSLLVEVGNLLREEERRDEKISGVD